MDVRLDEVAAEVKTCLLVHVGRTGAWNSSSVQQMSPDDVRNQAAGKEDLPEFECSCTAGRMPFRDTGRNVRIGRLLSTSHVVGRGWRERP